MAKLPAIALGLSILVAPAANIAFAAPTPSAPTVASLKKDLLQRKGTSFAELLKSWETRHGTRGIQPLLAIAQDSKQKDHDRYIALMGAARLGGTEAAPLLVPFLKDRSWMLRMGTLRSLRALANPKTAQAVLPLLKDPALVVRSEAVDTIAKLRPAGSPEALLEAIKSAQNYHKGKALWVPGKALRTLVSFDATHLAPKLKGVLQKHQDPELQRQTIEALSLMTGKTLKPKASLQDQVKAWEKELSSKS